MMNSSFSTEVSNSGGVSSLVQKWRGLETGAGGKPPPPPPPPGTLTNDDDSIIGDWESDRTVVSGRSSIRGRDSDATESERLRVADIIRKLTPNEAGSTVSPRTSLDHVDMSCFSRSSSGISTTSHRVRNSLDHQTDIRSRPPIASSPRIRGRQAYIDLLVQVERDRRKELQGLHARKPVSHFSHRGRIQAVLKLKFLRRAMEAKQSAAGAQYSFEYSRSHKPRTSFDSKFCREEVVIKPEPQNVHESFHHSPNSNSATTTTSYLRDSQEEENVCKTTPQQHNKINIQHGYEEDDHREAIFTDWESSNICNRSLPKSAEITCAEAAKTNNHEEAAADDSAQHTCTAVEAAYWVSSSTADHIDDVSNSHPDEDEGWEELHSDYQTKEANNRDWIDEVSRPRSDWEYLRQARYQEMLDPFMDKEDIRALLGRKSVSNFLSSDMREKIDQLMISRTQGPQNLNSNNQRHGQVGKQGRAEEEYGEYCDAYEEAESSVGQHYTDCDEYINPSPSASLESVAASWPENQNQSNQNNNNNININQLGRESSECSYQEVSPSTQQSSTNYCSHQDMMTGRTSSYNINTHPSIEMELIYDLRRHMEQLHQEISELRKSIKCSTDMQMKLHRSIKKEVTAALTHPDAKNGRRHPVKKSSTANVRRCSVCCKVQVDCVLYSFKRSGLQTSLLLKSIDKKCEERVWKAFSEEKGIEAFCVVAFGASGILKEFKRNISMAERSVGKGSGQALVEECKASLGRSELCLKLALLYVMYAVVIIRYKNSKNIQMKYLHLTDDVEKFNAYAWGRVFYEYMVMATHLRRGIIDNLQSQKKRMTYDAYNFVLALQCWAYEIILDVARYCATIAATNEERFPKMMRWTATQYFQYDDLMRFFMRAIKLAMCDDEWGFLQKLGLDRSDQVPCKVKIEKVKRVKRKVNAEVEHPNAPSKRKRSEPIIDARKSPRLTQGPAPEVTVESNSPTSRGPFVASAPVEAMGTNITLQASTSPNDS
ncbi:hypothetical protein C2S52_013755 [Perilla frutescens var. hirtella]|nr:hypothetical protein C2S52_013755 [Perilla frutescens var. hirtella]